MIRLGWPVPAFWRLRAGAGKLYPVPEDRVPSRAIWEMFLPSRLRASLNKRNYAMMKQFQERYEDLVDLLCVCAKEGIQPRHAQRYMELRSWFHAHYGSLRTTLERYLPPDRQSAQQSARSDEDPFAALFGPAALDALLHSEEVIPRIQRTRLALAACMEDLEARAS
ncbi:MAG: hypothetical protein ACP5VE_14235 [Chthonomonadales bacterium]